mgnify:FL=1|jgi:hypothetical protein
MGALKVALWYWWAGRCIAYEENYWAVAAERDTFISLLSTLLESRDAIGARTRNR